ncbi:MAG: response regulator [Alphaproteobacteria bacterium]
MARILVAEDDTTVQTFVKRALTRAGHTVTSVDDGLQALEALEGPDALGGTDYDLLITDISMPGLDGIGLALKVTRDHPNLRIILMTAYTAEQQRAHNLDEIVFDVVLKPFTLEQICRQAEAALA